MKLSLATFLGLLLLIQVSAAWPFPDFLSKILQHIQQKPIPILDLVQHSWLQNRDTLLQLGRLDDPKTALCNLSSELRPSNISHDFTYPTDLFMRLKIDTGWAREDRCDVYGRQATRPKCDWELTMLRVNEILNCPAALHDVEELKIQTQMSGIRLWESWNWSSSLVPTNVPDLFVNLLTSLPHLKELYWTSFGDSDEVFKKALIESNLTLPALRHLTFDFDSEYLVDLCPNLESVEYHQSELAWGLMNEPQTTIQFLQSLLSTSSLKSFTMHGVWKLEYVELLLRNNPHLINLTIHNNIWPLPFGDIIREEGRGEQLKNYTIVLARFPHLENLWLPDVSNLDVGFDGGPGCGNAYFGPYGRQYRRYITHQWVDATELATDIVLSKLPQLKSLYLGDTSVNFTRDESGTPNVSWPWTGRLGEYLYEKWPDLDGWRRELNESPWGELYSGNATTMKTFY